MKHTRLLPSFRISRRRALLFTLALGCTALSWALVAREATPTPHGPALAPRLGGPRASGSDHPTPADRRTVSEQPAATGWYGAPAGSWFRYAFDNRGTYGFAAGAEPQARAMGESMEIRCHGELELHVLERREEHADARVTFSGFSVDGSVQRDTEDRLAALLRPVVVRMSAQGEILGYRFAPELNGEQRNFQRWIVATFGFPVGAADARVWHAGSADATGEYQARFCGRERDGILEVERNEREYVAMTDKLGELPRHRIAGRGRARLSRARGWLTRAQVREVLTLEIEAFGGAFVHRADVRLELLEHGHRDPTSDIEGPGQLWHPAGGHLEDLDAVVQRAEADNWRVRLRDASLADLVLAIEQLLEGSSDANGKALHEAWTALSWFLRLHPERAADLHARVLAEGQGSPLASTLLSALGNAGTPQAQDALIGTYVDPYLDPTLRNEAALGMFAIAAPTDALVGGLAARLQGLTELAPSEASAMLALGALAERTGRPVLGDKTAVRVLLDLEDAARGHDATDLWLQALGNAGQPEILAHAQPYLTVDDPRIRSAAVNALRKLKSSQAVSLLAERARRDSVAAVRAAAIGALTQRFEPAARQTLHDAARTDPDQAVRAAALRAIAHGREHDTVGAQLIEQIANHDSSSALRTLAAELMRS